MKTWFKHDYNARNDEKLVNLSMNEGLEGLAIYWCLIEMLYENNGYLENNCDSIAFALHSQKEKINKIINDYFLFSFCKKENYFFNTRVLKQLQDIDKISEKARINAKIRWKNNNATAMRPQCDRNATAMQKEKRREDKKKKKEKIIISELSSQIKQIMDIFYKTNPTLNWGNKTTRKACEDLINLMGIEKVLEISAFAVSIQGKPYAPVITTPYQLKEKLTQLKAYSDRERTGGAVIIE